MQKTGKLELTWVGKYEEKELEPRILVEDKSKSFGDPDTGNMLIHGDNLIALKALEQDFAGRIKCIYIDPPYNTGHAFDEYEDGLEHSEWLCMMKPRLEMLWNLLADDGSIWITLDDNEFAHLKVLCDEIFGHSCFVGTIVWRSSDNSNNDSRQFSLDHNYIVVYSKRPGWLPKRVKRTGVQSKHYKNPDNDPRGPWFDGNPISSPNPRPNLCYDIIAPNGNVIKSPAYGWRWSEETLREKMQTGEIFFNNDFTNIKRKTYLYEQEDVPASTLWADLEETGHNRQAKYEQKKLFPEWTKAEWFSTPKPEKLIERVFQIATNPGDLVLDSFLGSGTTTAVAHKMGRRYIGIELGDHAYTHCKVRLDKVVEGEQGGISKAVGWNGGGGYKFYELAPSLLEKHSELPIYTVNESYTFEMLCEAICKLEGFRYAPQGEMHGKSSETRFIHIAKDYVNAGYIKNLLKDLGEKDSVLIYGTKLQSNMRLPDNVIVKKIPKDLLDKCVFESEVR